jgi:hypothetical protein
MVRTEVVATGNRQTVDTVDAAIDITRVPLQVPSQVPLPDISLGRGSDARLGAVAEGDLDPLLERQLTRTHVGTSLFHRGSDLVFVEAEGLECGRCLEHSLGGRKRVVLMAFERRVRRRALDNQRSFVTGDSRTG